MTEEEFCREFYFDPAAPRAMGYATDPSLVREAGVDAVSACVQLLSRSEKQPTGKWLWLQMQRPQALALAASILVLAKEENWPVRPDFLDLIDRVRLGDKSKSN